jgi:hypothetical protein
VVNANLWDRLYDYDCGSVFENSCGAKKSEVADPIDF